MKKLICCIVSILLMFSIALADSVTQMDCEIIIDDEPRLGKYTGDIENNLPNGYGIFVCTSTDDSSWHYIGYWQNGMMQGNGAVYWDDGSIETGIFENNTFMFGFCDYSGADLSFYKDPSYTDTIEEIVEEQEELIVQYIGNKNSKVFHDPNCPSVEEMNPKNKVEFYSRDEALRMNYKPCGACHP